MAVLAAQKKWCMLCNDCNPFSFLILIIRNKNIGIKHSYILFNQQNNTSFFICSFKTGDKTLLYCRWHKLASVRLCVKNCWSCSSAVGLHRSALGFPDCSLAFICIVHIWIWDKRQAWELCYAALQATLHLRDFWDVHIGGQGQRIGTSFLTLCVSWGKAAKGQAHTMTLEPLPKLIPLQRHFTEYCRCHLPKNKNGAHTDTDILLSYPAVAA